MRNPERPIPGNDNNFAPVIEFKSLAHELPSRLPSTPGEVIEFSSIARKDSFSETEPPTAA